MVKNLVEYGVDVNKGDSVNHNTPLIYACIHDRLKIAKYLLDHGANLDMKNNSGDMPIFICSKNGNEAIVQCLVEHGVDINRFNLNGDAPLHVACAGDKTVTINYILKNGKFGKIKYTKRNVGNINIIRYFIQHGADINVRNSNGDSPLHIACRHNNFEIVNCLLYHGADINVKNNFRKSPLSIACENKSVKIARYLIEHGADYSNDREIRKFLKKTSINS